MVIAHIFIAQWGEHLTVHKVDCLGEETVLVPGCPGIYDSINRYKLLPYDQSDGKRSKRGWLGCEESRVSEPFSSFWMYTVLEGWAGEHQ